MTDIVERLRCYPEDDIREAATEIERLRGEAVYWSEHSALAENAKLCAEIERLQALFDNEIKASVEHGITIRQMQVEIEQLRAALVPFVDYACRIDENEATRGYPDRCPIGLTPERDTTQAIVHLSDLRHARDCYENRSD